MRALNSIKNTSVGLLQTIITKPLVFFARIVFVRVLGLEYLGINSLFVSIVSVLAVAELGLSKAIIFSMYEPIAKENIPEIKSLMKFYKKSYRFIGMSILFVGMLLTPFIPIFMEPEINISTNVHLIFFLFVLDVVLSYLFSYKRAILYAHQKNYIISLMDLLYQLTMHSAQIIILLLTQNFLIFTLITVVFRLVENNILNTIADKKYPYIKEKIIEKLDLKVKRNLLQQIKGLLFHRIGGTVVLGMDSILIVRFLGLSAMGMYANYLLILSAFNSILFQFVKGIVASVGNLLTENDSEKSFKVYRKISFLIFWVHTVAMTIIYLAMDSLVTLWLGEEYLLSRNILFLISINFYIQGLRKPCHMFKEAAGIFYQDRFIPLIEILVKFPLSFILLHIWGIAGLLIATLISTLIVYVYTYPIFIYKPIFKRRIKNYFVEHLQYLAILVIVFLISATLSQIFKISNLWLSLFTQLSLAIIIPNIILIIVFRKTEEFSYFKLFLIKMLSKMSKG